VVLFAATETPAAHSQAAEARGRTASLSHRQVGFSVKQNRKEKGDGMKKSMGANTIACPSPVWCIGTYDKNKKPNIMTASWAGICCSSPPAISVSLRKATYTYQCILDAKAFTVNIPSEGYAKEVDYVGIASGKDKNKFDGAGLTPVQSEKVHAPYVKEFPLIIECKLIHHHEIGLHTLFVGEIVDVLADEDVVADDGKVDMEKIQPFLFSATNRTYYGIGSFMGKAFSIGKDLPGK
jgi:flavin reductase (DIM6/NTAB) family NADH-FMN oxidoreductase RutF